MDLQSTPILNVAIDGPSGVGKSTSAKYLSTKFGLNYLDAGSMYRMSTYELNELGITPQTLTESDLAALSFDFTSEGILVNGKSLEGKIRNQKIANLAADFSNKTEIFKPAMLEFQKKLTSKINGWVAEGRNMALDVMPHAEIKIYLTATSEERARRRCKQLGYEVGGSDYKLVLANINARDEGDYSNKDAPLVRPNQALEKGYGYCIDTSGMNMEQQLLELQTIIEHKMSKENLAVAL